MANYLTTDTDLTAVANAIRTKGGTSAQLAFPSGFVSAVEAIETGGGGYTLEDIAAGNVTGDIVFSGTQIRAGLFAGLAMTSFRATNLNTITVFNGNSGSVFQDCINLASVDLGNYSGSTQQRMFYGCTNLTSVKLLKVATIGMVAFGNSANTSPPITALVLPNCTRLEVQAFSNNSKIEVLDFSKSVTVGGSDSLRATNLKTIIYRGNSVSPLNNIANFNNTPFASGGSGGTLYVPSALISSYQSATNWSTILSYENNQILPIEGSIYETQYADGTPIT